MTFDPAQLEVDVFKSKLEKEEEKLQKLVEQNSANGDLCEETAGETRELARQVTIVNYLQVR